MMIGVDSGATVKKEDQMGDLLRGGGGGAWWKHMLWRQSRRFIAV